jgi:hypothetical protein
LAGVVKSGSDGAGREAQRLGDLRAGEAEVVVHHDYGALLARQPAESPLQLVTPIDTWATKKGLAQMLKGGVIMDVVTAEQAKIAEEAGAVAVMALERVPSDIRASRRRGAHERPRS